MENRYCVIMGGGIGSRFWPFSRNNRPKQFLDFFGIGRSLLQMSYDRFIKIIPKDHIFIVTNEIYVDLVKEQLPDIAEENILLEPTRRNTAPCIAWASYHIQALNPNANIFGSSHSQRRRIRSMRQSRARFRIKISGAAHLRYKAQSS